jgi:hypothetical protein
MCFHVYFSLFNKPAKECKNHTKMYRKYWFISIGLPKKMFISWPSPFKKTLPSEGIQQTFVCCWNKIWWRRQRGVFTSAIKSYRERHLEITFARCSFKINTVLYKVDWNSKQISSLHLLFSEPNFSRVTASTFYWFLGDGGFESRLLPSLSCEQL